MLFDHLPDDLTAQLQRPEGWVEAVSLDRLVALGLEARISLRAVGVDHHAELFVSAGDVVHATFAALVGADAVLAVAALERAHGPMRWRVRAAHGVGHRTIASSWGQLRARIEARRVDPSARELRTMVGVSASTALTTSDAPTAPISVGDEGQSGDEITVRIRT